MGFRTLNLAQLPTFAQDCDVPHVFCPCNGPGASPKSARLMVPPSSAMKKDLTLSARAEITRKYALAYKQATRADKSTILDQLCQVTGWSRDNARRRLTSTTKPRPVVSGLDVDVVEPNASSVV